MEVLSKLFGSTAKVKIMRLFLLNPGKVFDVADVALRARIDTSTVRRELTGLASISFIKHKSFTKTVSAKKIKAMRPQTKRASGWIFNPLFEYRVGLQDLLIDAEFIDGSDLIKRFRPAGKIKLMLTAGIFTKDPDSRLDLLLVGDNLKKSVIEKAVRMLESEIGKELAYAVFDTAEFMYRSNMYDKLVRDVIDFPHDRIIDIGLLEKVAKPTF